MPPRKKATAPEIFKPLATISVWVMFVAGWSLIIGNSVMSVINAEALSLTTAVFWACGIASLFLSVCTMKLRQMLD